MQSSQQFEVRENQRIEVTQHQSNNHILNEESTLEISNHHQVQEQKQQFKFAEIESEEGQQELEDDEQMMEQFMQLEQQISSEDIINQDNHNDEITSDKEKQQQQQQKLDDSNHEKNLDQQNRQFNHYQKLKGEYQQKVEVLDQEESKVNNVQETETEIVQEDDNDYNHQNRSSRSQYHSQYENSNGTSDTEDINNAMFNKQKSEMMVGRDRSNTGRKRKLSRVEEEIKQMTNVNTYDREQEADQPDVAYQSKERDVQSDTNVQDISETSSRKDIKKSHTGAATHKSGKPRSSNQVGATNHHKKRRNETNEQSKANSKGNINYSRKQTTANRSQQMDESVASKSHNHKNKPSQQNIDQQAINIQQQQAAAQLLQQQQQQQMNPWMQMMQMQMGGIYQPNMMPPQYNAPFGQQFMGAPYQQNYMGGMMGAPQYTPYYGGMGQPFMNQLPQNMMQNPLIQQQVPLLQQQLQQQQQNPQQVTTDQLEQIIQALKQMKDLDQLPQNLQDTLDQHEAIKAQIIEIQNENELIETELQKPDDMMNQSQILGELPLQTKIQIRRNEMIQQRRESEMMRNPSQLGLTSQDDNSNTIQKQTSETHQEQNKQQNQVEDGTYMGVKQLNQEDGEDQEVVEVMIEIQNSVTENNTIKDNQTDLPQPMGTVMSTEQKQRQQVMSSHRQSEINNHPTDEINEQDLVMKEIAYLASKGHDPTPELEKENEELASELDGAKKRERELLQLVTALEYENDILFGKSNSMDHSVQNYGKRLEELSKQIDELNAILRIKDQEMIEMTNEIHNLRMMKEAMRKEIIFRKQREDQLEGNIKNLQGQVEKVQLEQDDIRKQLDRENDEQSEIKDENKFFKTQIERLRLDIQNDQERNDQIKHQINQVSSRINDNDSKQFMFKSQIDRLRNENDQVKVDLSYAKATAENQREAYQKLNEYYQKQIALNQELDSHRDSLMLNKGNVQINNNDYIVQPRTMRQTSSSQQSMITFQEISIPSQKQTGRFSIAQKKLGSIVERQNSNNTYNPFEQQQEQSNYSEKDRKVGFAIDLKRSQSQGKSNLVQSRNFQPDHHKNDSFSKYQDVNALNSTRIKTILFDLGDQKEDLNGSITGQKRRGAGLSQTRDFKNRNFLQQMPNILEWQDKNPHKSAYMNNAIDPYREYLGSNDREASGIDLYNSFNNNNNSSSVSKSRLSMQVKSDNQLKKTLDSFKRGGPPAISVTIDPYDPNQKFQFTAAGQKTERHTISHRGQNSSANQSINLQQQGEDMHNSSMNLNSSMTTYQQQQTKATGRMRVGGDQKQSDPIQTVKRDTQKINMLRDELNVHQQRRDRINGEINKVSDKNRDGKQKRNNLESEMKQLNKKIGDIKLQLKKMDALKPIL